MTTRGRIKYRDGYKYQLDEDFEIQTEIYDYDIETEYATLSKKGLLHVFRGYAWDGPSGPTFDRNTNMRGSLPHDVLYQMIRQGLLPIDTRFIADGLLKHCWIEDGMWEWLAAAETAAVQKFGIDACRPSAEHMPKFAP